MVDKHNLFSLLHGKYACKFIAVAKDNNYCATKYVPLPEISSEHTFYHQMDFL